MNQKMEKGHGFFRKSKAYGLVCGIALGAMLFMGNSVSADELSAGETAPTAILTDNSATGQPEAQPETAVANSEATTELTSETLDQAVEDAKEAGVNVIEEADPVLYDTKEDGDADLKAQELAVREATEKQIANNTAIKEAEDANKEIERLNAEEIARVDQLNEEKKAEVEEAYNKLLAEYNTRMENNPFLKEHIEILEKNKAEILSSIKASNSNIYAFLFEEIQDWQGSGKTSFTVSYDEGQPVVTPAKFYLNTNELTMENVRTKDSLGSMSQLEGAGGYWNFLASEGEKIVFNYNFGKPVDLGVNISKITVETVLNESAHESGKVIIGMPYRMGDTPFYMLADRNAGDQSMTRITYQYRFYDEAGQEQNLYDLFAKFVMSKGWVLNMTGDEVKAQLKPIMGTPTYDSLKGDYLVAGQNSARNLNKDELKDTKIRDLYKIDNDVILSIHWSGSDGDRLVESKATLDTPDGRKVHFGHITRYGIPSYVIKESTYDGSIPDMPEKPTVETIEPELKDTVPVPDKETFEVSIHDVLIKTPKATVVHEFVSETPGKELPQEVTALTPAPKSNVLYGGEETPVAPTKTSVEVADGTWTFVSYDKAKEIVDQPQEKFVGTWVFTPKATPKATVVHEFVSGTPGKELPQEVTALTPAPKSDVLYGGEETPVAPSKTSVEVADGTWTFVSYDKAKEIVDQPQEKFVGTWVFTPKAVTSEAPKQTPTPTSAPIKVLPVTGDTGSMSMILTGILSAISGLGFAVRKRKED